ncbi:MAG: 50S ribosomal protein L11 methyltransferase [Firmicutes bacterium]|nr:50S ribosomal protein L11 methyltransferase [Bacillota bacterium]
MDLWRVTIETTSEAADTIEALLLDRGALGTEIFDAADLLRQAARETGEWVDPSVMEIPVEGARVSAYTPLQEGEVAPPASWLAQVSEVLTAVHESGLTVGSLTVAYEAVLAHTYEDAWKAHYHALDISKRIVVVPLWEREQFAIDSERVALYLDPGMAFGTGTHETTTLCLRVLEELLIPGTSTVLDVGTGSGILSLAAAKLGAVSVFAVDLDEIAVQVARDNALANGLEDWLVQGRLQFVASDLVTEVPDSLRFTIILANLLAGIIVRAAPQLKVALARGGCLVASGLVAHQTDEVEAALYMHGFTRIERRQLGDWMALLAFVE